VAALRRARMHRAIVRDRPEPGITSNG
jgi:hypothetical protein